MFPSSIKIVIESPKFKFIFKQNIYEFKEHFFSISTTNKCHAANYRFIPPKPSISSHNHFIKAIHQNFCGFTGTMDPLAMMGEHSRSL